MSPEMGKAINARQEKIDMRPPERRRDIVERNQETAIKVARLLAESRTRYDEVSTVFRMAEKYLTVSAIEVDS